MEAQVEQKRILTKKDRMKSWFLRFWIAEHSTSFERLQSLAFCVSLLPILKKLYPNKEDLTAAMQRHLEFFNTEAIWGSIINGIVISMEEQKALGAEIPDEAIIGIKTGLIGPFAGIGDTIDWGTLRSICIGLFVPFAADGHWWAAMAPAIVFAIITIFEGIPMYNLGYNMGSKSAISILQTGFIKQVITGTSVLGLFMMGALACSYVQVYTPIYFVVGGNVMFLQQGILDNLYPCLLSLITTMLVYWDIHRREKVVSTSYIIMLVAIICGSLGILSTAPADEQAITEQLVEDGKIEAEAVVE